jgi:hypothetical protein
MARRCKWRAGVYLWALAALPLAAADPFQPGVEVMRFPSSLNEISGMSQSHANPDVFWVHNDSGGRPEVYAVSRAGELLGTFQLDGAKAIDWEDMAIGPGLDGGAYLYLADIGDNTGKRTSVQVYRVPEPTVSAAPEPVTRTITGVVAYEFTYEDGPRDAESFFADPFTGDFYVVSKRELDGNRLYRCAKPRPGAGNIFTKVGTFRFTGATGADISYDGLQVLVRRYSNPPANFAAFLAPAEAAGTYWRRPDASMSVADLLAQPGQTLALAPEPQGEAITFAADGRGFYTTTERGTTAAAPLTYYAPAP